MSERVFALGLIQTLLMSCGLLGLGSQPSELVTSPPVALATNVAGQKIVRDVLEITNTYAGFVPGSLASVVWSGFHTNGRSTRMWEFSQLPPEWPKKPPVLRWNTNNLMWGRKGMTAISQVFEGMGAFGQGTPTALTRRHGYVRGHDMGPTGLDPTRVGRRVWFCTRDNQLVERKIKLLFIRAREQGSTNDYSIILFDADLSLGGISTSPPRGAQMQADMDMLSRKAGLDPRKYQMQWVNVDVYPDLSAKP